MKDPVAYRFEDFLSDDTFINYSRGLVRDDIRKWENWLATNPRNKKIAEEAKNIIKQINPEREPLPDPQIDDQWDRLYKRLELVHTRPARTGKWKSKWKVWHYAAALGLLLTVFAALFSDSILKQHEPIAVNEIVVPRGQIRNILLPDGTLVYINADTKLCYDDNFGKKNRAVTLDGEAYFVVTYSSDIPFVVHTCENEIRVLGTAFNVKAYPDGNIHQTSLERGKILISNRQDESYLLNPKQTYLLIRDKNSSKVFRTGKVEDHSSWTEGRLIIRNHRFREIARDLERSHEVVFEIRNEEILNSRYTGEFSRTDDIGKILEIISLTSGFSFEIAGDTITVK
jgi:ferric-dicitrate binding protein FerR (iron transport regulator)